MIESQIKIETCEILKLEINYLLFPWIFIWIQNDLSPPFSILKKSILKIKAQANLWLFIPFPFSHWSVLSFRKTNKNWLVVLQNLLLKENGSTNFKEDSTLENFIFVRLRALSDVLTLLGPWDPYCLKDMHPMRNG
jgi:hypothetical protein